MSARFRAWRRSDAPPLLLPAAFLLVGLLYVWATPAMEASDEPHHFAFAEFISRNRSLPVQVPGELTPWAQEGSQPPLYYLLVAALIAPLDTGDLPELMRPNPHAIVGDPAAVNNKNRFLHDPARPELKGAALALYVARLFSLALSVGSVCCVWLAARELGLQAGCNPRRLALLAGLIIWQMLAMPRHGLTPRRALVIALLALAALAILIPFISIRPAYFAPARVEELPEEAVALDLLYEDTELAGYHIPQGQVGPGDTIPVTLYWRPLRRSGLNYSFYVHLLNDAGRVLVRNYGFPGGGSLETSRWQPGVIHEDRWQLPIPQGARGDTPLRVQIGWWKYPEDYHLRARTHDGAIVDPVLLDAGSFSDGGRGEQFPLKHAVWPLDFGESIRLLARERNGAEITLLWEALAPPRPDLQVFLHVLNNPLPGEAEVMLAQGDSPPSTPTADWQPGRRYLTRHRLETTASTEPGEYLVRVGWYSMTDGQRLWADCDFNACPLTRIRLPAGPAAP